MTKIQSYERINVDELSAWLVNRLEEIFAYAAEPVVLKNSGKPLFLPHLGTRDYFKRTDRGCERKNLNRPWHVEDYM